MNYTSNNSPNHYSIAFRSAQESSYVGSCLRLDGVSFITPLSLPSWVIPSQAILHPNPAQQFICLNSEGDAWISIY